MGETLSAEEVRNEAIAAMGLPLGDIYHSLSDEVSAIILQTGLPTHVAPGVILYHRK
jgi:hypothetical protein